MTFFENEYALPIILGGCSESISAACFLRKNSYQKINVFAEKLSFFNRLRFKFNKLSPNYDTLSLLYLIEHAKKIRDPYFPFLVYCDNHDSEFIKKHSSELERYYVLMPASNLTKQINKDKAENENK